MAKLYVTQNDVDSKIPWSYVLLTKSPVEIIHFKPTDKLHLSCNPEKITPFLIDSDIKVFGSIPILTYIAENCGKNAFYGTSPEEKAKINSELLWATSTFHRIVMKNYVLPQKCDARYRLPSSEDNKLLVEHGLDGINGQLNVLEKSYFEAQLYLCGDVDTLADLVLANILMELESLKFDFSKWPKLNAWYNGMRSKIRTVFSDL